MLHFAASAKEINRVHGEAQNFQCEKKEIISQAINPRRQSIAHGLIGHESRSSQTVRAKPVRFLFRSVTAVL